MRTLALCVPVYREVSFETFFCLLDFARSPCPAGWSKIHGMARGQPVSTIREKIARLCVYGPEPADVLLWIDSDVASTPEDLWRLVRHLDELPPEVWVLGAAVPRQQEGAVTLNAARFTAEDLSRTSLRPIAPTRQEDATPDRPFMEVGSIGFGLVAVRREAFVMIERPWFPFETLMGDADHSLGEDIAFCDKVRGEGGHILVDLSVLAYHNFTRSHGGLAPFRPREKGPLELLQERG